MSWLCSNIRDLMVADWLWGTIVGGLITAIINYLLQRQNHKLNLKAIMSERMLTLLHQLFFAFYRLDILVKPLIYDEKHYLNLNDEKKDEIARKIEEVAIYLEMTKYYCPKDYEKFDCYRTIALKVYYFHDSFKEKVKPPDERSRQLEVLRDKYIGAYRTVEELLKTMQSIGNKS